MPNKFGNYIFLRYLIIALVVLPFCVLTVRPQTDDQKKLARAKALYEEANFLITLELAKALREAHGRFAESRELYQEAGDELGKAKALVGIGFTLSSLAEYSNALIAYEEALSIFERLKNESLEARTLNNIGRLYDQIGKKAASLEYYNRALPLRRSTGDLRGEAVTLNNIGAVYLDTGEFETALEFCTLALRQYVSVGDQHGEAIAYNNLGRVYDGLGDHIKSLEFFELSLTIRIKLKDVSGEATTLNNIGLAHKNLGDSEKALDFFKRALNVTDYLGAKALKANVLNNIGTVLNGRGEHRKAQEFYEDALTNCNAVADKSCRAVTLTNIGILFLELNDHENALARFNQTLPIFQETGARAFEAINLRNLMNVWAKLNKPDISILYGKQAVNKYQELRASIKGLAPETQRTYLRSIENNYREVADSLIAQGRFAQAEQVLSMLKEEEFFDFVRRDVNEIKSLNTRVALNEREQKLIERYSLLARKLSELGQKFQELDEKKRILSRIEANLSVIELKLYDELSAQLNDANAAFKLFLEKDLLAELGKKRISEIEIDRNLQAKLRKWEKGTVALYTVVSENRYRVVLTTPTLQIDGKTEIKASDLNKKIFAFRTALQNIEVDPRPLGKELYDILLKPIEKDLKASGAKTLVWSLDGTLRYIPIAALSPDGKTYLVEKYQNAILTGKTRDDLSNEDREWSALGVGVSGALSVVNPDKPTTKINFSPLPGTKDELFNIVREDLMLNESGILKGKRLLDGDFNRRSFSDSLLSETSDGNRRFTLVHIASHFRLGNSWTNSFLLLGDGQILTLEQISNSPEITFGDVELVTLSACNTAFADDSNGKEIDSLAEAVQTKSGKAVLATLWAVVDESTPLLMTEFYRFRQNNPGTTKSEGMQSVQRAMLSGKIKPSAEYTDKLAGLFVRSESEKSVADFAFDREKPFSHPYFWSPFVLIGNWR